VSYDDWPLPKEVSRVVDVEKNDVTITWEDGGGVSLPHHCDHCGKVYGDGDEWMTVCSFDFRESLSACGEACGEELKKRLTKHFKPRSMVYWTPLE
jgi:hypothetical protein